MRIYITIMTILVWICLAFIAHAQPIIVDHTCTDISKIPEYWLEQARKLTFHYAHTSHGSQINSGIEKFEELDEKYNIAIRYGGVPQLPSEVDALRIYDGNNTETYITPGLYWSTVEGLDKTRSVAATGYFNYSMWSWCGEQSSNSEATVNQYLTNLNQLETEYPSMRFIFMTGHTDGGSLTLQRNNEMVRQYVRDNSKVLFDFADIETYDPDGGGPYVNNGEGSCQWCETWCTNHPEYCNDLPASCAHSDYAPKQQLFCKLKGQAFWWLMARLAGWDGGIVPEYTLTVTKEGSGKGTVRATGLTCGASTCHGDYSDGAVVTITAQAQTGSYFDGWADCDDANGHVCIMTMNADKNVTALFRQFSPLVVKPKSLNLGKVSKDVVSDSRTITVRNGGAEDVVIDSLDITGTHGAEFHAVNGCASSIPPEGSCNILVTVTAQDYGKREGLLQILSNGKTPVVGVKLKAKAGEPKISVSPRSLNFGKVNLGSSSPARTITVRNTGISDLVITSVVLTDNFSDAYTLSTSCSTLGQGETCAIEATFTPVAAGLASAQIEIQSNDPDDSPLRITVKGKAQ